MFATDSSTPRPVVLTSEEEIPPWWQRSASADGVAEDTDGAPSPRPGFAIDPVETEDNKELVYLHYRLRHYFEACQPSRGGGEKAVCRFLSCFLDEAFMVEYLEWQPAIADFLQERLAYYQRISSDPNKRLARAVLKAFFVSASEWE